MSFTDSYLSSYFALKSFDPAGYAKELEEIYGRFDKSFLQNNVDDLILLVHISYCKYWHNDYSFTCFYADEVKGSAVMIYNPIKKGDSPIVFGLEMDLGSNANAVLDRISREYYGHAYDDRIIGDFDKIVLVGLSYDSIKSSISCAPCIIDLNK